MHRAKAHFIPSSVVWPIVVAVLALYWAEGSLSGSGSGLGFGSGSGSGSNNTTTNETLNNTLNGTNDTNTTTNGTNVGNGTNATNTTEAPPTPAPPPPTEVPTPIPTPRCHPVPPSAFTTRTVMDRVWVLSVPTSLDILLEFDTNYFSDKLIAALASSFAPFQGLNSTQRINTVFVTACVADLVGRNYAPLGFEVCYPETPACTSSSRPCPIQGIAVCKCPRSPFRYPPLPYSPDRRWNYTKWNETNETYAIGDPVVGAAHRRMKIMQLFGNVQIDFLIQLQTVPTFLACTTGEIQDAYDFLLDRTLDALASNTFYQEFLIDLTRVSWRYVTQNYTNPITPTPAPPPTTLAPPTPVPTPPLTLAPFATAAPRAPDRAFTMQAVLEHVWAITVPTSFDLLLEFDVGRFSTALLAQMGSVFPYLNGVSPSVAPLVISTISCITDSVARDYQSYGLEVCYIRTPPCVNLRDVCPVSGVLVCNCPDNAQFPPVNTSDRWPSWYSTPSPPTPAPTPRPTLPPTPAPTNSSTNRTNTTSNSTSAVGNRRRMHIMELLGTVQVELVLRLEYAPNFFPTSVSDIINAYDETLPVALMALTQSDLTWEFLIDAAHVSWRLIRPPITLAPPTPAPTNATPNVTQTPVPVAPPTPCSKVPDIGYLTEPVLRKTWVASIPTYFNLIAEFDFDRFTQVLFSVLAPDFPFLNGLTATVRAAILPTIRCIADVETRKYAALGFTVCQPNTPPCTSLTRACPVAGIAQCSCPATYLATQYPPTTPAPTFAWGNASRRQEGDETAERKVRHQQIVQLLGQVQIDLRFALENIPNFRPCTFAEIYSMYDRLQAAFLLAIRSRVFDEFLFDLSHMTIRYVIETAPTNSPNTSAPVTRAPNFTTARPQTKAPTRAPTPVPTTFAPFWYVKSAPNYYWLLLLLILPIGLLAFLGYRCYLRVENKIYRERTFHVYAEEEGAPAFEDWNGVNFEGGRKAVEMAPVDASGFDPFVDVADVKMSTAMEDDGINGGEDDGQAKAVEAPPPPPPSAALLAEAGVEDGGVAGAQTAAGRQFDVLRECIVEHSEVNIGHLAAFDPQQARDDASVVSDE